MSHVKLRSVLLFATLAVGIGCAKPAANPYSQHYGEAYWANRNASIENPNAGGADPVLGLDGATTEGVMENYRESQLDQPPVREADESVVGTGEGS